MYLTEYQKVSIDNFMGLWDRGSLDDVPVDHASDILNMTFSRKREVLTRPSASFSHNLPNGDPILRQFDATFDNVTLIPLVLDNHNSIWRLDNYTVILNIPTMIDFSALNMNNHVYIAPILDGSNFSPTTQGICVWVSPSVPVRFAAGLRPGPILNLAPTGSGNVGPGWYGVSMCYVYDTGYVTPPGPVTARYFPGGTQMVFDIPGTGANRPQGVVGYLILSTKSQNTSDDALRASLYEVTTTNDINNPVVYINFFDTDLVILASDDPVNGNLFNSMPRLPTGYGRGSVALIKYRGRMIIIGPAIVYDPAPVTIGAVEYSIVKDGRVFVSHPGAPENFDTLTGYLIIQPEFDGNIPRTGFELFGVLYICKAVGTFAAQDTGSDPNDPSNPWIVNVIDGGIGAYHHAVGTITGSQPALSFNSTAFLANRSGLFIFNGNVLRPELSWKIRGIWSKMTINAEYQIRVTVDIYNDIFYVMIPVTDKNLPPYIILVGDYSLGLDSSNIRWSVYKFPWNVYDIVMASFPDPRGLSYYYLRLGSDGAMYKLDGATTADEVWSQDVLIDSVAIDNYYQSASLVIGDIGSLNIYRFIRYRMAGQGNLVTTVTDQGESSVELFADVSPLNFPGNYKDLGIQINFTNEKLIVRFRMNDLDDYMRMARFDVFGKQRWPTRPNA